MKQPLRRAPWCKYSFLPSFCRRNPHRRCSAAQAQRRHRRDTNAPLRSGGPSPPAGPAPSLALVPESNRASATIERESLGGSRRFDPSAERDAAQPRRRRRRLPQPPPGLPPPSRGPRARQGVLAILRRTRAVARRTALRRIADALADPAQFLLQGVLGGRVLRARLRRRRVPALAVGVSRAADPERAARAARDLGGRGRRRAHRGRLSLAGGGMAELDPRRSWSCRRSIRRIRSRSGWSPRSSRSC